MLRKAGHDVFFIDNYLEPCNFFDRNYLQVNRIDYIGIYANTICYRDTLRMIYGVEYLRRSGQWHGKIIVGGPHTSVAFDTIPEFVDHVVQGEGEQAIVDIVEGRISERLVRYPRIENLDVLPMQAWDDFARLSYNWGVYWFPEKPVFTMTTSRGCPFNCAFCSVKSIWGNKYTFFSAKRIVHDIEYLVENHAAKGIYFREDNFTFNRKRVFEFCNLLLERGVNIHWACESRVDNLDQELLNLMYKAGARGFYFGVESGSQKMLDFLNKGITVNQIRKIFALCHNIGFKTAASVVVGVPQETEEDVVATEMLLEEIKPSFIWHNVFVGIPNSKLYKYVIDHNLYEFIDDRGLVYLKGHNTFVKKYYKNEWNAEIPIHSVMPEISVIMAAYNAAKHIGESIKSVLKQTYQNFEFIIVDDASTDETERIIEGYNDRRIKVIKNVENIGPAKSRNKAIAVSRGRFIAIMDADDISLPHRFETQINILVSNPDCALVGSSAYMIDEDGTYKSIINVKVHDDEIRKCILQNNCFVHGSVMIRRNAMLDMGGYNDRFKYSHDYDLWLRIIERYRVGNLPEPLYCWRLSSTQISSAKKTNQNNYAELAKREACERVVLKILSVISFLEARLLLQDVNSNEIAEKLKNIKKYLNFSKKDIKNPELDCYTVESIPIINTYFNDEFSDECKYELNSTFYNNMQQKRIAELEKNLQSIFNSRGWKILLKYYKLRDCVFLKIRTFLNLLKNN